MDSILFAGAAFLIFINTGVLIFFFTRKQSTEQAGGEGLQLLNDRIGELSRTLDERLDRTSKTLHESVRNQMSESFKLIRDVTAGLTKLDETNRQVVSFADQLQNLQDILKNPK